MVNENRIEKEILNLAECAELLTCSRSYLYKKVAARVIPSYCPTGRIYFKRDEVISWVLESKRKTVDQIKINALVGIQKNTK